MKSALESLASQPGGDLEAAKIAAQLADCAAAIAETNPKGAVALAEMAADIVFLPSVLAAAQGEPGLVSRIKSALETVEMAARAQGIDVAGLTGQIEQIALAEQTATPTAAGGGAGPAGAPAGISAPFASTAGSVSGGGGTVASPAQ